MKYNKLILSLIVIFLTAVQSLAALPENFLQENQTEQCIASEYVISASVKEIKPIPVLKESPATVPVVPVVSVSPVVGDVNPCRLFLRHRSFLI